jgi:hypothetical protein
MEEAISSFAPCGEKKRMTNTKSTMRYETWSLSLSFYREERREKIVGKKKEKKVCF